MARKYKQGKFTPVNPLKYVGDVNNIVYRSSWELKFMNWADTQTSVTHWNSEEIIVPYISPVDNRTHRYFVDFAIAIKTRSGVVKKYLVEVKPDAQTRMPVGTRKTKALLEATMTFSVNNAKWAAAEKWAVKNGMEFIIFTEKHLKI